MFFITIGPLSKHWGRIIKVIAIGVVLLLIVVVAWQVMGTMSGAGAGDVGSQGPALATFGSKFGSSFWQRFMNALEQWFKVGF